MTTTMPVDDAVTWLLKYRAEPDKQERINMRDQYVKDVTSLAALKLKVDQAFGSSNTQEIIDLKSALVNAAVKTRGPYLEDKPNRNRRWREPRVEQGVFRL